MIRQRKPMKRGKPLRRESKKHAAKRKRPPVPAREPITWPIVLHEPREPVHSTTARSEGVPRPKDGRFDCRELRDFHKRQPCAAAHDMPGHGECEGPLDPHHFPSRGAGGDDLSILTLCRKHHDQAQRYGMDAYWQSMQAAFALTRFLRMASEEERLAFFRSWQDFAEARVWTVPA